MDRTRETKEAIAYPVDAVDKLERAVCNDDLTDEAKILCWFARLGIGSSTRFSDRQATAFKWLNVLCGGHTVGKSGAGETGVRNFACSDVSLSDEGPRWIIEV